jgi:predicted DNA-binding protein with PD1-like motif
MTNEIDINKKYRTRDGHEVRIYATDGMGLYPVHGAISVSQEHRDSWSGHMFKGWSLEC